MNLKKVWGFNKEKVETQDKNKKTKKISQKKLERLRKNRLSIQERIGDPERMSIERARKTTLRRFFHDPVMHKAFLNRPDMTKSVGISFCKRVKNPQNWFLLFKHETLKFSVPEMLYWSILADRKYNCYSNIAKVSETISKSFCDLSILSRILEREDVLKFVKEESIFKLYILKTKLDDKKITDFISQYRKDVWNDPEQIIPIRLFSFLIMVVTKAPLWILLRFHLDIHLQTLINKKKH